MSRAISLIIGVGSFFLMSGSSTAADPLRIGVDIFPPFSEMAPDGTLKGFDIDIGNAICKEMQRKCTWVKQDWDGIIPALQAGKFDAIIASMSITPERSKIVDFTDKYYQSPARFVAKEGVDWEDSNNGLSGKVVGVQRGSTQHNYMMDKYPDVKLKLYGSPEDANIDLSAGRVDAVFADSLVTSESFLKTELGEGFAFFGDEHSDPEIFGKGEGIAIRKNQPELKLEFNNAIKAVRENGVYQEINNKYFDFDIYGD